MLKPRLKNVEVDFWKISVRCLDQKLHTVDLNPHKMADDDAIALTPALHHILVLFQMMKPNWEIMIKFSRH